MSRRVGSDVRGGATLTVLGAGTLLPDAHRRSASHLLEMEDARVLMDCGPGTLHGFASHGVAWETLSHVAITHFHADHFADLVAVLFAFRYGLKDARDESLTILGPVGIEERLRHLAAGAGPYVLDPGFPLHVHELIPGVPVDVGPGRLDCHATPHTDESVCFRWTGGGVTVGYTGDTGPDASVAGFLTGCDVLIAECALQDPPRMDTHLSPRTLAELARTARPGRLVVTHVFPPLRPEEAVRQVREAGYDGAVTAGSDGLRIMLGGAWHDLTSAP